MLVIVKDRDVHPLFQSLFNDEAIGCGNVFQIDAAKSRFKQFNCVNEALRIFGVYFDIDRINIREAFEKNCLTLHDRL